MFKNSLFMIIFILFSFTYVQSAKSLDYIPTFCNTMEDEKNYIEGIIKNIKSLETGYTPNALHHDKQFHETKVYQNKDEYDVLLEQTLENIRQIAKLREETIYLVHPPESGNEYQKCCAMTCSYLSKNRDAYK